MNWIDLCILAILAIGFLIGWYKGCLVSLFNLCSYALAWLVAFIGYRGVASFILQKTNFDHTLLYLTAGVERISDMSLANADVSTLGAGQVSEIISGADLPEPVGNMMAENITNQSFFSQGITTLSDYYNQTLINLAMGLVAFLILFFAVRLISMFAIGMVDYAVQLPVLKQCDKVVGGVVGIAQGAIIVAVIFAVIPVLLSILPMENFAATVQNSFLGRLFFNNNFIFNVLRSVF